MATAKEEEILEGFLCPICKADLKSASQLTSHFESLHQGEQDVLKSLKDIFGKAKKVILNADDSNSKETIGGASNSQDYYPYEEQTIGMTQSYTDYFKDIRSARTERYAAETNKLLIRLEKLIRDMPDEPNQRKKHEQNVVPWLDGTSVNLCPDCANSFTLTRRKHHCRLCGSIICHDCSVFMHLSIARTLVDPPESQTSQELEQNEDDTLRMCEHCYSLLALRKDFLDDKNAKSAIVTTYRELQSLMDQMKSAIALHHKMRQSVCEGDGTCSLSDITDQQARVGKIAEDIARVSKKIMELPAEPNTRHAKLQEFIRIGAAQYVKEQLIELRKMPTQEEINEMKRKRYENTLKNIQMERASVQIERMNKKEAEAGGNMFDEPEDDEDNPLIEQMNIIRAYLQDARKAMKHDEVFMLERNLRELKKEYHLQKLSNKA